MEVRAGRRCPGRATSGPGGAVCCRVARLATEVSRVRAEGKGHRGGIEERRGSI